MVGNRIIKSRFFEQYKKWLKTETKSGKDAEINEKTFSVINNKNSEGLIFFNSIIQKKLLSKIRSCK